MIDQLAAQNAVTGGYHAQNPHLFDMAWMSACLVVLGIVGAVVPNARHLVGWFGGGVAAVGVAGLCFGEGTAWSLLLLGTGALAGAAQLVARRAHLPRTGR